VARRDFVALGQVPPTADADLSKWLVSLKENVELLAKQRGDPNNAAVLKGDIATDLPAAIQSPASGATAVQLAADLQRLRDTLNNLMLNLKT
jgi:hypothetical protein